MRTTPPPCCHPLLGPYLVWKMVIQTAVLNAHHDQPSPVKTRPPCYRLSTSSELHSKPPPNLGYKGLPKICVCFLNMHEEREREGERERDRDRDRDRERERVAIDVVLPWLLTMTHCYLRSINITSLYPGSQADH